MPAEICSVCHHGATTDAQLRYRNEGNRGPIGSHHGTGCRFGRCSEHCSCTRTQQESWRSLVRGRSEYFYRCSNCNVGTNHACGEHSSHIPGAFTTRRHCGRCCVNCNPDMNRRNSCEQHYMAESRYDSAFRCRSCGHTHTYARLSVIDLANCVFCSSSFCGACSTYLTPETRCEECGRCYDNRGNGYNFAGHCRCNVSGRPRLYNPGVSFVHADDPECIKRINPIPRAIGVEIEVCGFRRPTRAALKDLYETCQKWGTGIGTDGSIGDAGVEIRTSPAAGVNFVKQLRDVVKAIRAANGFVDHRAGLHVHVDMRDTFPATLRQGSPEFMVAQRVAFVDQISEARRRAAHAAGYFRKVDVPAQLYHLTEARFYAMADATRQNNRYANPWVAVLTKNGYSVQSVRTNALQYGWAHAWQRHLSNRYTGLNLEPYTSGKRTLEFRLHQGCISYRMIRAYALMCAAFVHTGVTAVDPLALEAEIKANGALAFLQRIAPTEDARRYLTYQEQLQARKAA